MAVELKDDGDIDVVSDADLVPGGDKDTSYNVRHITIEKNREIVAKNTKPIPNRRTHVMEPTTDWQAVNDDLLDYAISDWRGIVAKGEPLPCTRENKMKLDALRRDALLQKSGLNEVQAAPERRAESFRPVA